MTWFCFVSQSRSISRWCSDCCYGGPLGLPRPPGHGIGCSFGRLCQMGPCSSIQQALRVWDTCWSRPDSPTLVPTALLRHCSRARGKGVGSAGWARTQRTSQWKGNGGKGEMEWAGRTMSIWMGEATINAQKATVLFMKLFWQEWEEAPRRSKWREVRKKDCEREAGERPVKSKPEIVKK